MLAGLGEERERRKVTHNFGGDLEIMVLSYSAFSNKIDFKKAPFA